MGELNISLPTIDDALVEGNEQFSISLSNPTSNTGANITGSGQIITTIVDTNIGGPGLDTAQWILTGSDTVNEGASATYILSLDGLLQNELSANISLAIANISTDDQDYGSFSDAVALAVTQYNLAGPGALSWDGTVLTFTSNGQEMGNLVIELNTIDDLLVEGDEQFSVSLSNPGGSNGAAVTANAGVTTTIIDTDNGGPALDTAEWIIEGTSLVNEGGNVTYNLVLDGVLQSGGQASITLNINDVTTNSQDYHSFADAVQQAVDNYNLTHPGNLSWNNGILTFTSAGQAMENLVIVLGTVDDLMAEGNEQFNLTLTNPLSPTGANITGGGIVETVIVDTANGGPGLDTVQWVLSGTTYVNEGAQAQYALNLNGLLQSGEKAYISLNITDISTNIDDYAVFVDAVSNAVAAYNLTGPGVLEWDGSVLTYTSAGLPMGDLIIGLLTNDDTLVEGDEQFRVTISNPGSSTGAYVTTGAAVVETTIADSNGDGTIRDTANWTLIGSDSVTEGATAQYIISLDGVLQNNETAFIELKINNITTNAQDYASFADVVASAVAQYNTTGPGQLLWNGSVITFISNGQAMGNLVISLNTIDDILVEGREQFSISLSNPGSDSGATITGNSSQTTEIIDTDAGGPGLDTAQWYIDGSGLLNEGDTGIYTISLSGTLQSGGIAQINLAINNITTNSQDYASFNSAVTQAVALYNATGPGTLTWNGSILSFTSNGQPMGNLVISLETIDDIYVEGNEQFSITISNPQSPNGAYVIGTGSVTTTLIDTDVGNPAAAQWVLEGSAAVNEGDNAVYTLNLGGTLQSGETAYITLTLNDGTTNAQDYNSFNAAVINAVAAYNSVGPGSFVWDGSRLTFTSDGNAMGNLIITLGTIDDTLVEGNEQFSISFSDPGSTTGAGINGSGVIETTIIDTDNGGPGLDTANWTITGSTLVNEGANASYTVHLAGIMQNNESASIALNLNNLTTNSEDYASFNTAVNQAIIAYNLTGPGQLSWDGTNLTFISNGQEMGNLNIVLNTIDDTLVEGNEQFEIVLSNPGSQTGAHVTGNTTITTTIADTNPAGTVTDTAQWSLTGSASVNEGANALYTVNLSGTLQNGETAFISLNLTDIGTNNQDYASFTAAVAQAVANYNASGPGQLTWNSSVLTFTSNGQAMGNLLISLATVDDALVEGNEQFRISINNPGSTTGANIVGNSSVDTTIIDTNMGGPGLETAQWSLSSASLMVNEGANAIYTVNLSGTLQSGEIAVISLNITDIGTNAQDYSSFNIAVAQAVAAYNVSGPGTLSWNGSELSFLSNGLPMGPLVINLLLVNDTLVEGNEDFRVSISNPGSPTGAYVIGSGSVTTTIVDANADGSGLDTAQWLLTGSSTVNEGAIASYTLHLDGVLQSGERGLITLNINNITTNAQDYASFNAAVVQAVATYNSTGPGSLSWNGSVLTFTSSGQAMGNLVINLATIDDALVEGNEQFSISITNPSSTTGANITGTGTVQTTIVDTNNGGPNLDTAQWSLSGSTSVAEGLSAAYTLKLSGILQNAETAFININLNNISTNNQDYASFNAAMVTAVASYNLTGPGQLTWNNGLLTFISNGQAMGDLHISLATIDDTIVEGTEQFSLSLSNPGSGTGAHVIGSGSVTTSIIDNDIPHFAGSGDSVLLSTVGTAVLPNFQGAYGLSLLNPVQGDLTGLINTLIGPGGILQGETFENALAIVLSQQGVLFNTDAVQLTDSGSSGTYQYQMAFNGSENFINYQNVAPSTLFGALSVTDQLSLLGYSLDGLHDLGNGNLLFTTTGGGNLPYYNQSTGSYTTLHFSNEDVILAVKQPGGFYTYQKFFDGSSDANLDDSLLNLPGVLRDFSIDGLAYSGSLQNGTMYFSLSNLVDVNIAPLLGLDVMGALFDNGGNVYSIQKVNGVWDKSSIAVFFNAAQFGWTNELLENALIDLAQLHVGSALASAINALIGSGQVANYFNIDALDIDGNTMYFSVSSLLSVDLINLLRQVITNPLDPLYALTLRGENIYTISRENASSAWNLATLSLYLDGSNYGLGSSSGLLGNISDNLIEDVNAFSLVRGDHSQPTIMFTTAGGGNESQLGGYNAGTIVQVNNGTFYKAFDLAAVTNNMVTNNSITGFDVLENGTLLLVLGKTATLPGGLIANPNSCYAHDLVV